MFYSTFVIKKWCLRSTCNYWELSFSSVKMPPQNICHDMTWQCNTRRCSSSELWNYYWRCYSRHNRSPEIPCLKELTEMIWWLWCVSLMISTTSLLDAKTIFVLQPWYSCSIGDSGVQMRWWVCWDLEVSMGLRNI